MNKINKPTKNDKIYCENIIKIFNQDFNFLEKKTEIEPSKKEKGNYFFKVIRLIYKKEKNKTNLTRDFPMTKNQYNYYKIIEKRNLK